MDADGTSNEADISGETSGTYTPVAADVGKKIKVQVSFTDNGSNAEGPLTSAAYPSNAPVAAAAGACPAVNDWCTTLTVGLEDQTHQQLYGFFDTFGALVDTTIDDGDGTTWTVSQMNIQDTSLEDLLNINLDKFLPRGSVFDLGGTMFTTDTDSEQPGAGRYAWLLPAGFAWVDGQDVTVSVKLPANAPATGVPVISGKPQVGATLSAGTTGIMDFDGLTSVSYTYQWIRVDVDGTSNPVNVGTDDEEYTLVPADEGKRIKVQVTFTDDDSNAEELTSDAYLTLSHQSYPDRGIMPARAACPAGNDWCATMTVVSQFVVGTAVKDFGFSASPAYGALDDTSFDYDGSTFTVEAVGIRDPDNGSGYHVRLVLDVFVPRGTVFDLNGYGFTTDATSEQSSAGHYRWDFPAGFRIAEGVEYRVSLEVTENTPAEGKPTISGPAQVGRTLTAATADITDDEGLTTVSYEYQWIAAGTDIGGATSATYTPTSSVQGDRITVRVTFDDDADNPETLTSEETAPVVPDVASCGGSAVWCSRLTVEHGTPDMDGEFEVGLATNIGTPPESFGSLAGATFTHLGTSYTVTQILASTDLVFATSPNLPDDGAGLSLHIQRLSGTLELKLSDRDSYNVSSNYPTGTKLWIFHAAPGTGPANPPLLRGYIPFNGDYRQDTDEGTLLTVSLFQVNSPPVFPSTPAMRSVAENTASAQDVGAVLTATDSDNDPLTYTLEGTDAASFGIESDSGQIFTIGGVNFDHETKSTYTVVVKADDSNGGTDTIAVTITVTDVNEPPAAPAAPTVSAITGSTTSLTVSWTAPANTGPPIDDYDLQYRQGNSGNFTNGPQNVSGTPATIDNLLEDTVYQVQVRASNDEGTSGWSPSGSGRTSGGDNTATEVTILASSSSVPYSTFHDATFTVMRTGLFTDALTVTVNLTQDRPFLEAADLVRTVRIEAGSSSQNLVVSGTQLQLPVTEPVETGTLTATVAPGTGYDIGSDASASVDIVPFMTVRLEMASYTVSEDVGSLSVKVIARTGNGGAPPSSAFVLSISTESNTATVNQDYRLFSAETAFQPGTFSADGTAWKAEKTVEVTILNDTLDEPDESFSLQLQRNPGLDNRILIVNSAGAAPANIQRSTITIEDDDLPATPTVSFGASAYTAIEGVQSTAVTVQLIPADDREVTIQLTETPQGGASSADYSGVPGSVTFAAGETEQTFTVTATDDSVDDDGESVRLGFDTLPSGITLGSPSTARVALVQDAGVTTWYVWFGESSYTVAEGGTTRITLHLNSPWKPELNEALTVPLFDPQHEDGASADDYSGVPASVTFQRGQTQTSFTVRATDDSEDDDGESVVLHFRRLFPDDLEAGRYGARVATLHLADNDGDTAVTVSFEAANYTAAEGGATATVRLLLDTAPGRAVTIPLTPSHRGATAGDYSGLPASVTFGASDTVQSFILTATDDSADDDRESVAIGFGSLPSKVSAGSPSEAVVQLTDNDHGHTSLQVRFDARAGTVRDGVEEGGGYRLGVSLNVTPGQTLTIPLTYSYLGGATAADFSNLPANVTFGTNATSAGVTIRPVDDFEDDPGESLKVSFGSLPAGVSVGSWSGRSTIIPVIDNDALPGLSVADASAREWPNPLPCLIFVVTMDRMDVDHEVRVDYATRSGTAAAGQDFTPIAGTLVFRVSESRRRTASKSLCVKVLDDSHDEGIEQMTLVLSNPVRASLVDGTATGSISNTDPMPRGFLGRFGRTAAVEIIAQVEERIRARRAPGMSARLAGRELRSGMTDDVSRGFLRQLGSLARSKAPVEEGNNSMAGFPGGAVSLRTTGRTGVTPIGVDPHREATGPNWIGYLKRGFGVGDLLTGSSFELNRETGRSGMLSFWSRGARSQFTGREDRVTLDGRTATTMAGADYRKGRLVAGLSLAHSRGQGDYKGVDVGALASSVTGLYPWLGYQATDRITVWGVTGFGKGSLRLTPGTGGALETGLSMAMAAAGMRGELVAPVMGGFGMAFKTDALWVATSNAALDGPAGSLAATRAVVTRLRAGLEASRGYDFRSGLSLQPSLEVGLRQDDGNAETGAGVDVAGGLIFSVPSRGIKADLRVRTLLMHQDQDYRERGVLVSFSYDPKPSTPLGMMVRLEPSWGGQARSAAEALWSRETMEGLGGRRQEAGARFDTELAYGLPVGGRLVGTPLFGIRTSATSRYYQLGYKLAVLQRGAMNFELGVAAQRRESLVRGTVDRGVTGRVTMTW